MHCVGRQHRDAAVAMFRVVPFEEDLTECSGLLDGLESLWEIGSVFHCFELRLRVRIVV